MESYFYRFLRAARKLITVIPSSTQEIECLSRLISHWMPTGITKKFHARASSIVIAAFIVLMAACSSMDDAPKPTISYTSAWEYANESDKTSDAFSQKKIQEKKWWELFSSPELIVLITNAQIQNSDVIIAAEHVRQAELQMKIANASLFPALGLSASTGERNTKLSNANWTRIDSTTASVNASYEVDLWGGVMASRHSAKSFYKSSVDTTEATRLSISAAVASAWFSCLALQERVATAKKNIEIAEHIQKIVDSLYHNGAISAADVAIQKTNVLNQHNALLPLQLQLDQTRAAIALLEGQVPQAYLLPYEKFDALMIPEVNPGLPADIVTRRPDVAAIEAQLQAASANVYEARAALFPSVDLSGTTGKTASQLFMLNPATQTTGWSLTLAQILFAGGRVKNQVRLSESRRVELIELYHKAILTSLQEVDDALHRGLVTHQQELIQQQIVEQAEHSLQLSETRYREGGNDLLSLLDAQRSVFQAQDTLVQQRLARLKAAVDLYKALGGGWKQNE